MLIDVTFITLVSLQRSGVSGGAVGCIGLQSDAVECSDKQLGTVECTGV